MRKVTIAFTFETDAGDDQLEDMAAAAFVQIAEPEDSIMGTPMDATTQEITTAITVHVG